MVLVHFDIDISPFLTFDKSPNVLGYLKKSEAVFNSGFAGSLLQIRKSDKG